MARDILTAEELLQEASQSVAGRMVCSYEWAKFGKILQFNRVLSQREIDVLEKYLRSTEDLSLGQV